MSGAVWNYIVAIAFYTTMGSVAMFACGVQSTLARIAGGGLICALVFGAFSLGYIGGAFGTLQHIRYCDNDHKPDEVILILYGWKKTFKIQHEDKSSND